MPETTPTEEQEHVAVLFERYELYHAKWGCACLPIFVVSIVIYFYLCTTYNPLVIMLLFIGVYAVVPHLLYRYTAARFAKQLSEAERKMIKPPGYMFPDRRDQDAFEHLMKASAKINPKQEYLRPSQQTQNDTLLRAAHSTADTPQDQLLRPAPTDEKTP